MTAGLLKKKKHPKQDFLERTKATCHLRAQVSYISVLYDDAN